MLYVLMIVGFCASAYSVVANDVIQTLGTFLSSNAKRPWWVLWLYASSILVAVLLIGYLFGGHDPSWGRLDAFPMPANGLTWVHLIPPIAIIFLTKWGIPVSTTFLILTIFAPSNLTAMLTKSLLGYVVAFVVAIVVFRVVIRRLTEYFDKTYMHKLSPWWVVAQWASTAFLWSQWLIQDLANLFIFLPRQPGWGWMIFAIIVLVALHAIIFYTAGGQIQKIVTNKTGTRDIRAATVINIVYGLVLLIFKEVSNMPMSTTWVFLGLLAGREIAIATHMYSPSVRDSAKIIGADVIKATIGLFVSVVLAFGLPVLATWIGAAI